MYFYTKSLFKYKKTEQKKEGGMKKGMKEGRKEGRREGRQAKSREIRQLHGKSLQNTLVQTDGVGLGASM